MPGAGGRPSAPPTMRLPALLLLLLLCSPPALAAGVPPPPLTLDDARALAVPGRTEVRVREVSDAEDVRCHDPACMALALPFVLWDLAFERHYDVAVVEGGRERLAARYARTGALIDARLPHAGGTWVLRRLALPRLGETLLLAQGPAPEGAPARAGALAVRTPPELLERYRGALAAERTPARRAALLTEAWDALGVQALPLYEARLASADEPGPVRDALLERLCAGPDVLDAHRARALAAVLRAPADAPPPGDALARCVRRTLPPAPAARAVAPYAPVLVASACAADAPEATGALALLRPLRDAPALRAPLPAALARCPAPGPRARVALCLGAPVAREALVAAFAAHATPLDPPPPCAEAGTPEGRAALLAWLEAAPSLERLRRLAPALGGPASPDEAALLARLYAREVPERDGGEGAQSRLRAGLLELFRALPAPAAARARAELAPALEAHRPPPPARGGLLGALARATDQPLRAHDEGAALAAALALLGEPAHLPLATRALDRRDRPPRAAEQARDVPALVLHALVLLGCAPEALPAQPPTAVPACAHPG